MIDQTVQISECPGWLVKPRSRRIAEFIIADGMFVRLFQPGLTWRVERNPLPADARLIGVRYDVLRGSWLCYIESETFEEMGVNALPTRVPAPILHVEVIDAEPEKTDDA